MSEHTNIAAATIESAAASIDLAEPRLIVLQGRRGVYKLDCRTPQPEDWAAFYGAITISLQRDGADQVKSADYESASRLLAERVLIDAHGYTVHGDKALTDYANWPALVPLEHRLKVGDVLASVQLDARDDEGVIYPEGEAVFVSCLWNPLPERDFHMRKVSGLKHVLQTPSEQQYRRYARESSRSRILGGSRAGTTLFPGAQMVLAALYDELVVSVEGYVFKGQPLAGREQIIAHMDTHHKVVAAQQMFIGVDRVAAKVDETGEAAE